MTKNRDIEDFCMPFKNLIAKVYGVKVISEPSSFSADIVADRARKTLGVECFAAPSLEEAIKDIGSLHGTGKPPALIVVCGSLFLASDLLSILS
jgi:dihydrofolate synthase / folylpolyglutamate synthase